MTRPLKIMFVHGLESGPHGTKVGLMRAAGAHVIAPDMQMSLRRLDRTNSVVRQTLRLPHVQILAAGTLGVLGAAWSRRSWSLGLFGLGAAGGIAFSQRRNILERSLTSSFESCVETIALALQDHQPDVILGSSWGGAVSLELTRLGLWRGPLVTLAPAYGRVGAHAGWRDMRLREAELRAIAASQPIHIYHDPTDDTVPIGDSEQLALNSAISLHVVRAGGHRLLGLFEDDALVQTLQGFAPHEIKAPA